MVVESADGNNPGGVGGLLPVAFMVNEVWLDWIPGSQKNKTRRVTAGGRKVLAYTPEFRAEREKLMWMLKGLDKVPEGQRFCVEVALYPEAKKTLIRLTTLEMPRPGKSRGSDPDGVLVTIMDALKLSGRIADDSINHVHNLSIEVNPAPPK